MFIVKLLVKISPLHFLLASVKEMGWGVSVENKKVVSGLVVGTKEFMERYAND